jgi:hypothetical protein
MVNVMSITAETLRLNQEDQRQFFYNFLEEKHIIVEFSEGISGNNYFEFAEICEDDEGIYISEKHSVREFNISKEIISDINMDLLGHTLTITTELFTVEIYAA